MPAAEHKISLSKSAIESALATYFNRKHCCLTNRGTTALTAALSALNLPAGSSVVFPAAMCSIPVFSADFAGLKPVFADVSLVSGNFDFTDLERVLQTTKAKAVIPLHMFGRPEEMTPLRSLCDTFGVALIEDTALSMGALYQGKRAGSFGDIACLSFVRKMLPLEMGGAVLTDDPVLDRKARAFLDRLPPMRESNQAHVAAAMKAFHMETSRSAAGDWIEGKSLLAWTDRFREVLLAGTVEADWEGSIVLDELAGLDDAVQARRARAEIYETAFHHPKIVPLNTDGSSFFAYPVRLEGVSAEAFLNFASERGFQFKRVAYPVIAPVFGERRSFPNAETLEKELIGFPVDDNQPVSSFWEYAEDFTKVFNDYISALPILPAFDWRGKLEARMS